MLHIANFSKKNLKKTKKKQEIASAWPPPSSFYMCFLSVEAVIASLQFSSLFWPNTLNTHSLKKSIFLPPHPHPINWPKEVGTIHLWLNCNKEIKHTSIRKENEEGRVVRKKDFFPLSCDNQDLNGGLIWIRFRIATQEVFSLFDDDTNTIIWY